jgi:hypothetical protein
LKNNYNKKKKQIKRIMVNLEKNKTIKN